LGEQGGKAALQSMRARGAHWLALAESLEADLAPVPPASAARSPRPAPAPPAHARLRELPVTRIETLIRDPYAVYAERILRLRPLDPLAPLPDARQKGTALHRIPDLYLQDHPPGAQGSLSRFLAIAETVLAEECPWPAIRTHWLARLERVAPEFVRWNQALTGVPALTETKGALVLGDPPFTLTGKPDRIDRDQHGDLHLFDYKTGSLPSPGQIEFFNKQLILLALMAEEDAFGLGPARVAGASFVGLGSRFGLRESPTGAEVLARHRAELLRLIDTYRDPGQGFTALRAVDAERRRGDFDALARRGEWAPSDPVQTLPVGLSDG
jgi:RecB family exonuclease